MPYPNEHAARIKDPGQYDTFARKQLAPGVSAILGIKNDKSEVQAIRFDSSKFTPEQAQAWLSKNKMKPIEFAAAVKKEELPKTDIPQYVDVKLEYNDQRELTKEELDGTPEYPRGFRIIESLVALRPGTFNGLEYSEEVLKEGAESYIQQPDGLEPFFKLNHSENIRDRAGPIKKSYWCDEKKAIVQDGLITNPEAIELFDAKLLTTTSSEHFAKIGLEESEPDKLKVKQLRGLANAFVTRPACKTCGLQQLDEINEFLSTHPNDEPDYVELSDEEAFEAMDIFKDTPEKKKGDNKMEDKKSIGIKILEAIGIKPKELLSETEQIGGKENMTEEEKVNLEEETKDKEETKEEQLEDTKEEETQEEEEKLETQEEEEKLVTLKEEDYTKMLETLQNVSDTNEALKERLEILEDKDQKSEAKVKEMQKDKVVEEILEARKLLRNPTSRKEVLEKLDDKKSVDEHLIVLEAERDGLKSALSALPEGQRPINAPMEVAYEDDEEDEDLKKLEEELSGMYQGDK